MSQAAAVAAWTLQGLFGRMLGAMFSNHVKRLILLSSLAAYMNNIKNPDNAVVTTLNELFKLSKSPAALKLPMQMSPQLWGKFDEAVLKEAGIECDKFCQLHEERVVIAQLRIIASRLIQYMPNWLKYDSNERIKKDIINLMLNAEKFTPGKTPASTTAAAN